MIDAVVGGLDLLLNLDSSLEVWIFVGLYLLALILCSLALKNIQFYLEDNLTQVFSNWRQSDQPILTQYVSERQGNLLTEDQVKLFLVMRAAEVDTECIICLEVSPKVILFTNPQNLLLTVD